MNYSDLVQQFYAFEDPNDATRFYSKWLQSHSVNDGLEFLQAIEKHGRELVRLRNVKQYIYLVTFTIDPKKHPNPDVTKIEQFIESQPHRSALKAYQAYYARETHKNGMPHWHMCIKTHKPLRSDAFKHYSNHYGHVDISRTRIQDDSEIASYITKEGKIQNIQMVGSSP